MRALAILSLSAACAGPTAIDAGADAAPHDAGTDAGAPPIVAPELADREALLALADLEGTSRLDPLGALALASSVDRGGGGVVPPLLARGNRDMNHFVCRAREGDVREPNLVELVFDEPDQCPEAYARGVVLARFEGPGVMIRFWSTLLSIRGRPPDRERFLVWVDDEPAPVIDVPLRALLDEPLDERFAPPFGAGAADRVAWYYPIAFATKLVVAYDGVGPLDLVYHQTTVRRDDAPRRRADAPLLEERAAAVASLRARYEAGEIAYDVALTAGVPVEVATLAGPATLHAIGARSTEALDGVRIRVRWDGADAIDLPLLELFGAALAPGAGPHADGLALRLPMPFASEARIELEADADARLSLFVERAEGALVEPFGRLHAIARETRAPAPGAAHPVLDATGAGRLAGVCLMLEGRALPSLGETADALNFLEGDERMVVDGGDALFGTGTEDYLDGAFYFGTGAFETPFAQAWGVEREGGIGRTSACRWHLRSHAVAFDASFAMDLEIGPGAPETLERYRSVAYVYR